MQNLCFRPFQRLDGKRRSLRHSILLRKLQHAAPDASGNAPAHLHTALPLRQQLLHRCDMAVGRLGASLIPQNLRDDPSAQGFILSEQLRSLITVFFFSF